MQDEAEFRRAAQVAIGDLKQHLIARGDEHQAGFEVEEQGNALNVHLGHGAGKLVIMANGPTRQIWIATPDASFKLEWDPASGRFALARTGDLLTPLVDRLIDEHLEH
jgi:iron donor protein CyaY